jgi:poly-gamma-glutamate capsule biosynthesis protein CapA/YwtB (metallophosphatase superfamily)
MNTSWMRGLFLLLLWSQTLAADGHLRLALVGDVMLAENEGTGRAIAKGIDPFVHVRDLLAQADWRAANFESSAGTRGAALEGKPYVFRTAPEALSLYASVFNLAGLANNHVMDYGRTEVVETARALARVGVKTFGAGEDLRQAHRALLLDHKGVKLALLGYLDFMPRWFTAAPGLPGVAWLDIDQARLDIARARQAGAEVVVVVPHWGVEQETVANQRQRAMARKLIDAGADAVIGGHPHVVQDVEVYRGKPVVYSLGNFVFDGFDKPINRLGWMLQADVDKQGLAALQVHVVHLDHQGFPVPAPTQPAPCWTRGQPVMGSCLSADRR